MPNRSILINAIPQTYDQCMGNIIFGPCADEFAAALPKAKRVLELACGTGQLTTRLVAKYPQITATDLSRSMIAVAKQKMPGLKFMAADAQALQFENDAYDLVVCQFGVMFVEDKLEMLKEARRVLSTGGKLCYSAWQAQDKNPSSLAAEEVVRSFFPNDGPSFFDAPFSMSDESVHQDLLTSAGFTDVTITPHSLMTEVANDGSFAEGMIFTNRIVIELAARDGIDLKEIQKALEAKLASSFGEDVIRAPINFFSVEATK